VLLRVQFKGASAKRQPFKGWVGKITAWPEGEPPELRFGRWIPEKGNRYNGGCAEIDGIEPGEVFLYGAASKEMRVKDKTTLFGRAELDDDGQLRVARLHKEDGDARLKWQSRWTMDSTALDSELAKLAHLAVDGTADPLREMLAILNRVAEVCLLKKSSAFTTENHIALADEWLTRSKGLRERQPQLIPIFDQAADFVAQWKDERMKRRAEHKRKTNESLS
jgi:hypothetical protein